MHRRPTVTFSSPVPALVHAVAIIARQQTQGHTSASVTIDLSPSSKQQTVMISNCERGMDILKLARDNLLRILESTKATSKDNVQQIHFDGDHSEISNALLAAFRETVMQDIEVEVFEIDNQKVPTSYQRNPGSVARHPLTDIGHRISLIPIKRSDHTNDNPVDQATLEYEWTETNTVMTSAHIVGTGGLEVVATGALEVVETEPRVFTLGHMMKGDILKVPLKVTSGSGRTNARYQCVSGVELTDGFLRFSTTGQRHAEYCLETAKKALETYIIQIVPDTE